MLPKLEEFLLSLQVNNFSPETIYNYECDLKVFSNFLKDEVKIEFLRVSKQSIEHYKGYLASRDRKTPEGKPANIYLSSYSRNRYLSSLRSYLKYLIEMDQPVPIAPDSIKLIKTEKKLKKVAELKDLIRLIEYPSEIEKKNQLVAKRNRAMLEVLFSTGLRISELVGLNKNQIDNEGKIFVMGKGKKERFVYLTPRAIKHVKIYLAARGDDLPHLFINYRGSRVPTKNRSVSTNYLQEKIKKYRELLGINVPTSAHSLRHGFATYLAESGANPAAIQILLGHESLDTTTRYVHASQKFAKESHQKFHPLKD